MKYYDSSIVVMKSVSSSNVPPTEKKQLNKSFSKNIIACTRA